MIDIQRIQELIPHRDPFLFVDQVTNIDTEENSVVAQKKISIDEPFFRGHFPGNPIMPGVLIIEALAQTGLICLFELKLVEPDTEFFFTGIEQVKFRRPVVPGDLLELHAKFLKRRRALWKFEGRAFAGGQIAAEGVFTAYVNPRSDKN
ncbi:MAG: 3-hydroxyacyl-ACP dehydratase FabZ [Nitrospinae bacterium]|nr:3-hydroxyacyl-ACP dehydratase FabZ [Nitrospinota bacterium]